MKKILYLMTLFLFAFSLSSCGHFNKHHKKDCSSKCSSKCMEQCKLKGIDCKDSKQCEMKKEQCKMKKEQCKLKSKDCHNKDKKKCDTCGKEDCKTQCKLDQKKPKS